MKFLHLTALATAALALPQTLPSAQAPDSIAGPKKACTTPKLRKNWAKATPAEKKSYINAVLCLATKPSKLRVSTHSTLYDDFGYIHAQLNLPQRSMSPSPT